MTTPIRHLLAVLAFGALASVLTAATYYVDSVSGHDTNPGTSQSQPWQTLARVSAQTFNPGDSILFRRDRVWVGQLAPKGEGSAGNPIVIDAYGTGAKPQLQGNGADSFTVRATVSLKNQAYWEIRNLDISNYSATNPGVVRFGVHIEARHYSLSGTLSAPATVNHIHLVDLDVHDVNGDPASKNNGGIFFVVAGETTSSGARPTRFNDVLIDRCTIRDVVRTGIANDSIWSTRTATDNQQWVPSTNFRVRDCIVTNAYANAIVLRVAQTPIIEGCLLVGNGNGENGNAAFFYNTDDGIMQNNEAYGTVLDPGDHDAGGFDGDYRCKRTVIQYNYAHDNDLAGIVLICMADPFLSDAVIRYNILQNNAGQAFRFTGKVTNAQVYNNTIYVGPHLEDVKIFYHKLWSGAGTGPDGTTYRNNLIVTHSPTTSYDMAAGTNSSFSHNLFHGFHPASEPADAHKLTSNPLLYAEGSAGNGADTVAGYKLRAGSPALNSGTLIANNGGFDYWANTVSSSTAPHRGAYNGPAVTHEAEGYGVAPSHDLSTSMPSDAAASGGKWLKFPANAIGQHITFSRYLPAGSYAVSVRPKRLNDRGIYQLAVADSASGPFTNLGPAQDHYSANTDWTPFVLPDLVTFATPGTKFFRFTVTGKHASSAGYILGVDLLTLTYKRRFTIEGELLTVAGKTTGVDHAVLSDGAASQGKWLKFSGAANDDQITFSRHIPAGTYRVRVLPKRQNDRGIFQLATATTLGGTYTNLGGTQDHYSANTSWAAFEPAGTVTFGTDGVRYFRFTVVGGNPASSSRTLGLDALELIEQ